MSQSRPPDARIADLTEKKSQLDAQIAALDARRRLSQKKDEDRIKWLLGTLVFDNVRCGWPWKQAGTVVCGVTIGLENAA